MQPCLVARTEQRRPHAVGGPRPPDSPLAEPPEHRFDARSFIDLDAFALSLLATQPPTTTTVTRTVDELAALAALPLPASVYSRSYWRARGPNAMGQRRGAEAAIIFMRYERYELTPWAARRDNRLRYPTLSQEPAPGAPIVWIRPGQARAHGSPEKLFR